MDLQRAQAFLNTPKVIEKAVADYNKQFGRNYSAFLEEYKTDGADYVSSSRARTAVPPGSRLTTSGNREPRSVW